MSPEPLPTTLDVRKAAAREVTVNGCLAPTDMKRLRGILASEQGAVRARCRFHRDEENRSLVDVAVHATLQVTCQRCLEPMPLEIETDNSLAIVGDDELAKQLPANLEPWVVEGEQGDLWSLVEDELILEIPIVAYHDTKTCNELLDAYRQPPATTQDDDGDNPFKVLEQLKSGSKQQEK